MDAVDEGGEESRSFTVGTVSLWHCCPDYTLVRVLVLEISRTLPEEGNGERPDTKESRRFL